jgi:membrane-associated phospholipid phosphatase
MNTTATPSARPALLTALTSLLLVALIGLTVGGSTPGPGGIDASSVDFREWAAAHAWLEQPLLAVEWAFDKHTLPYWTLALAVFLLARRQLLEAVLTVAVMWGTLTLSGWGKELFGRDRPEWQNAAHFHESGSFPSSHAAGTAALMGLVLVFVVLRSRSAQVRLLGTVLVGTTLVAVLLDRLLLGRHYPSDLAAGVLLGGAVVLVSVAVVRASERGTTRAQVVPLQDREPVLVKQIG